eukprot:3308861-Rhodomonas_salina.1
MADIFATVPASNWPQQRKQYMGAAPESAGGRSTMPSFCSWSGASTTASSRSCSPRGASPSFDWNRSDTPLWRSTQAGHRAFSQDQTMAC